MHAYPSGLVEYMRRLDVLTVDDAIWTPYTGHIVHREFDDSSLYSGFMRWETLVARHLSERCLRQYVMSKTSHDQFWIFHLRALTSDFRVTSLALVVPLEIAQ